MSNLISTEITMWWANWHRQLNVVQSNAPTPCNQNAGHKNLQSTLNSTVFNSSGSSYREKVTCAHACLQM